jgi:hypothetical protein
MPVMSGGVIPAPGQVACEEMYFLQAANNTGGTYTASVTVPANSWIIDIRVYGVALWNSATSAALKVGDATVTDGWYTAVDLLATDLLADEVLSFDSAGGKPGAYNVAATGLRNTMWSASARVITGVVTEATTTVVPTGKTRVLVLYTTSSDVGSATFAV